MHKVNLNPEMLDYGRCILRGLLFEEFDKNANNKKFELIETILKQKSYLFSDIQLKILRKARDDIVLMRKEGCYSCWILEEGFFKGLNPLEQNELLEIYSKSPIVESEIEAFLKLLERKFLQYKILN